MTSALADALLNSKGIDRLNLPSVDGRFLIDGFKLPQPRELGKVDIAGYELQQTLGFPTARNLTWEGLHFRKCDLRRLKIFVATIQNCVFESCDLSKAGLWNAEVRDCRFSKCNLRQVALGGIDNEHPVPNAFRGVVSEECDFRQTSHSCERYEKCLFDLCRFSSENFLGAIFEDCTFTGNLRDVTFRDLDPGFPKMPANHFRNCDFRRASIARCEFLNVEFDAALLPDDHAILVLLNGKRDLQSWFARFDPLRKEKTLAFMTETVKGASRPYLFPLALFGPLFTEEEIGWLKEIAYRESSE